LIDSSASDPFSLASNATPQDHASNNPVFPYDPSAYDNLTIIEFDAQFASFINAKLKEQSVAFQQRQQVGRRNTVDDADDDMPALLPPGYPLCNDSVDNNTGSDAGIVPPEEDHIASRVGRCHRQGTSLLSYTHHVAFLVLPAQMTLRDKLAVDLAESIDPIAAGDPGSDPTPFLPEPSGLYKVLKQPIATRRPWIQSLVKELRGLVKDRGAFKKEQLGPNNTVVPVKEAFKCKLDQHGNVNKLKARIVFRGDLYTPTTDIDSWNPHATWPSLQLYLAMCAKFGIFPSQADSVMAYHQVNMKERVFVQLPSNWTAAHMPDDLKPNCSVPLFLMKVLYGYTFSGKFLYEEQEEFLISFGMQSTPMPTLWRMHLPGSGILMVLQYSDDFLITSTDAIIKDKFKTALSTHFEMEWKPQADWFLQARIRQDASGNISFSESLPVLCQLTWSGPKRIPPRLKPMLLILRRNMDSNLLKQLAP
jgi:hypothetical protein